LIYTVYSATDSASKIYSIITKQILTLSVWSQQLDDKECNNKRCRQPTMMIRW